MIVAFPDRVAAWTYYCDDCSDSGWLESWCPVTAKNRYPHLPMQACGRDHHPTFTGHTWVQPCFCRATNPKIQKAREAQAQYAAQRTGAAQRTEGR